MTQAPQTLGEVLAEAAGRSPERTAVRCDDDQVTYDELNALADALAVRLRAEGVRRGDRVGLHLAKRIPAIAAVYGVMKAGAAYVPLDRAAPTARNARFADDCGIRVLITDTDAGEAVRAAMAAPPVVLEVEDLRDWPSPTDAEAVADDVSPDDAAYILSTSGSTGVPKGVVHTHASALAFVQWAAKALGIEPSDRLSSYAPLHFDLSVFDLYVAALVGATLVIVPERMTGIGADLAAFVEQEQITTWYSVPSALTLLADAVNDPEALTTLRRVVFAGEVFPIPKLRQLHALVPDATLWNFYGPTETNVCTYLQVRDLPSQDEAALSIGRACENDTEAFAVTADGTVAGVGIEGELFVRGPTVMRGYWGMPERDSEVLVVDPRGGSGRCYRTGDIVRLRDDGAFDLLGRRDHQVKSRGYRIELGEVEAALHAHPGVAEAVAVAIPHEGWGTAVVGCVVLREGVEVAEVELRRHVSTIVPRYMVPVRIDFLDALPRMSNGKADRGRIRDGAAAIPVPGSRLGRGQSGRSPSG